MKLQGSKHLTREKVEHHLTNLETIFDETASVSRTRFFFSSDITKVARPIAIHGSRKLIQEGYYREAVFWIAATFARCHTILAADDSRVLRESLAPAFSHLLSDLGIVNFKQSTGSHCVPPVCMGHRRSHHVSEPWHNRCRTKMKHAGKIAGGRNHS